MAAAPARPVKKVSTGLRMPPLDPREAARTRPPVAAFAGPSACGGFVSGKAPGLQEPGGAAATTRKPQLTGVLAGVLPLRPATR